MRGAERIVFAFAALGEARKPATLPQRTDTVTTARDDLVRIGLVAHVPHQLVLRRVEHIMDRHGQFDHAEARAEVPASGAHGRNHLGPQFVRKLAKLRRCKLAEIVWCLDRVEQRRCRF